jgi:hypothetical protein
LRTYDACAGVRQPISAEPVIFGRQVPAFRAIGEVIDTAAAVVPVAGVALVVSGGGGGGSAAATVPAPVTNYLIAG